MANNSVRVQIEKLAGSGAHACNCPRSIDGGCTCALKDEYIDEIMANIKADQRQTEVEARIDELKRYWHQDRGELVWTEQSVRTRIAALQATSKEGKQ